MSEFGFISEYKRDASEEMVNALNRAIELNPNFGESYDLYAFVSLVRNENIEDAVKFIRKALSLAPGNQSYLIRLAELYMRKEDFANARKIAQRVAETAAEKQLKLYAENTLERINSTEAQLEEIKNFKSRGNSVIVVDHQLSEEEIAALREKAVLEGLNRALRKPNPGEKRVLGMLTKIQCDSRGINFSVGNGSEILKLHSANFDSITLMAYDPDLTDLTFDCDSWKKEVPAVIIYRPSSDAKTPAEILSIEIVPPKFRFL
jgi:tetratricopeptide (TPR) repeat protein